MIQKYSSKPGSHGTPWKLVLNKKFMSGETTSPPSYTLLDWAHFEIKKYPHEVNDETFAEILRLVFYDNTPLDINRDKDDAFSMAEKRMIESEVVSIKSKRHMYYQIDPNWELRSFTEEYLSSGGYTQRPDKLQWYNPFSYLEALIKFDIVGLKDPLK